VVIAPAVHHSREALLRLRLGRANSFLLRFLGKPLPDDDALRSALTTAAVATLFVVISPLYGALAYLLERPPAIYYGLAGLALLTALSSLALLKRGWFRLASHFLLAGGTTTVALSFLLEGARSQAAGNFVIVIVMAALLVGWRGVLVVGLPSVAAIVVGVWAEKQGLAHPLQRSAASGVFALMQVVTTVSMLVFFDGVRLAIVRAREELEAQLVEARRLEALGRMAGGVAHDFNNLLTVILASQDLLSRKLERPSELPELSMIHGAATRAAQLTRQLLAISRRQKLEARTLDFAALLEEELRMLHRVIPETIRITVERPKAPLWVHADPGQLSQVLLNLTLNARDAMPDGGELGLSLEVADARALLTVKDTGTGMSEATLERVFEPFFTTKSESGTGLGLATVHGIVSQSGGTIQVESAIGRGTVFRVSLPLASAPTTGAEPAERELSARLPSGTVLLVEDDSVVRAASARALSEMGLEVIESGSLREAVERFRAQGEAVDLVVTDVVMPGGSGPDLVRALSQERPVRALFVSGYLDQAQRDLLLSHVPFLSKPFSYTELREKIQVALAAPPLGPRG
jgi:signal transduction histidine kinase/CheY-like chemotaxis protein